MKKTIAVLFILATSSGIQAQLTKGTFMPGISLNYSQNKGNTSDSIYGSNQNSSYKRSNIYTGINFGYFIKNNFAVGINAGFQKNNSDYSSSSSSSAYSSNSNSHQMNNNYNFGLFTRYYKMINNGKFGMFIQASVTYSRGYGENHQKYVSDNGTNSSYLSNYDTHSKANYYSIGLTPGIVYFITDKIGIETSFGLIDYSVENSKNYSKYNQTGKSNSQGFGINLSSSSIRLGLNYYLGRSKE